MAILRDEATFIAMEKLHESYNVCENIHANVKIVSPFLFNYSVCALYLLDPVEIRNATENR